MFLPCVVSHAFTVSQPPKSPAGSPTVEMHMVTPAQNYPEKLILSPQMFDAGVSPLLPALAFFFFTSSLSFTFYLLLTPRPFFISPIKLGFNPLSLVHPRKFGFLSAGVCEHQADSETRKKNKNKTQRIFSCYITKVHFALKVCLCLR